MDAVILLIPIALLLWLILRGRKQQRAVSDLQASLAVGQRVMTASGLYGTVVEVGDTTVDLEPSPGVRMTWARAAVARVVDPVDAAPSADSAKQATITSTTDPSAPPTADGGTHGDTAPGAAGTSSEAPERHDR
ncbi:preprotein translocase subunit YajC [Quadrisphaera granulorum]|uniref:Preprotein translocase subunit YajC n=1 Tax=Quadrisphaera granulorum TaxID=317664 RepID=A0A316A742_9ACTN|nr:preprotein translocase subunit YajC [Quadrisphaera granulorum]PWJ53535.1 preprotein translocase subunit YajC [Quadrisphaera granulorum]SZE96877.1 preprotein translocase subunit YajC [Quadrisphaera granulorum]